MVHDLSPAIEELLRLIVEPRPSPIVNQPTNLPLIKVVGHVLFEDFLANVYVYFKNLYSGPKGVIPKYFNLILDILCVISIYT